MLLQHFRHYRYGGVQSDWTYKDCPPLLVSMQNPRVYDFRMLCAVGGFLWLSVCICRSSKSRRKAKLDKIRLKQHCWFPNLARPLASSTPGNPQPDGQRNWMWCLFHWPNLEHYKPLVEEMHAHANHCWRKCAKRCLVWKWSSCWNF